jgi:hypothetical protein
MRDHRMPIDDGRRRQYSHIMYVPTTDFETLVVFPPSEKEYMYMAGLALDKKEDYICSVEKLEMTVGLVQKDILLLL